MQKIAIIVGLLAASLFSAGSYANSYDRGIKLYRRADFKGAERAFLDVLRGGANRATKGRIYKYIGLCQYMMGRKKEARVSFHSALKNDPKTEIFPNEALDSSVLEFFLQIKQDSKKGIGVVASPPPASKRYPSHGKAAAKKRTAPKQAPRRAATAKTAPKQAPRRAATAKTAPRPVAKKPPNKKATTAKPSKSSRQNTRDKRQVAKKKAKKDNLFTGKTKKPPRVIFRDKNGSTDQPQEPSDSLLLPPGSDSDSSYYSSTSNLWHFLPFGVGQYMNDNYKLGHAFAAAGILTLGSFVFYLYTTQAEQQTLDEYYEGKAFDEQTLDRNDEKYQAHFAEWDNLITEWEDYVAALRLYSYLSLAGFVAVWAGGVVEAILNRPSLREYSLLVPKVHYRHDFQGHQFALLWQYQLP